MNPGLVIFAVGLAGLFLIAVFVLAVYRLAGVQRTRLETRRWAFLFGWMAVFLAVFATSYAAGLDALGATAVSVVLIGLPVLLASIALRGRHWLFTPATDEVPLLEERRQIMRDVRRRPAFWLLVGAFLVAVPAVSLAIVLLLADI